MASWDDSYRLAVGDEASGDRGWLGEIRRVLVTIGNESIDLMTPEAVDPADDVVGRARLGDLGRVIPRDALVGSVLADALISSFGVAVGSLLVDIVAKHRRRLTAVIGQR